MDNSSHTRSLCINEEYLTLDVYKLLELSSNFPVYYMEITQELLRKECPWGIGRLTVKGFAFHYNKIVNADLSYPIIMYENYVLDGYHRLVKAVGLEHTTIKTKCFDTIPYEAILRRSYD